MAKTKKTFYTEISYVFGIIFIALGAVLMQKADLGMSMVVAPAYLLYLKLSPRFSFFTFGMAEYALQAVLLVVLIAVVRKVKLKYLFSFVTAVIYGFVLDGLNLLLVGIPADTMALRIVLFIAGLLCCSIGVSMMFHTYISPEVYELFVKEVSARFGFRQERCKTCYDCISCAVSVIMSFAFYGFGHFEGVKLGTIVCALINGTVVGLFTKLFERMFTFRDRFPNHKIFAD